MQGIDVSNWQRGIDLSRVPCDFVIAKATEGTGFVDACCDGFVQQAIELGKCWGFYHYVTGAGARAEADHFVGSTAGYFRAGIPVIDWESGGNSAWGDTGYLADVVRRVIDKTGVRPLIYASASAFPWDVAESLNCGAWVAQYASDSATGYQDSPWNEGAYACAIRQYSSHGRLPGYSGDLDIDKAYTTREQWARFADPDGSEEGEDMTQDEHDMLAYIYGGGQTDNPLSWNYNWKDGDGDYTARGGNMYNCVNYTYDMVAQLLAQETAQTAAIEALSKARGADPEEVAKAVKDAVAKKLGELRLTVTDPTAD